MSDETKEGAPAKQEAPPPQPMAMHVELPQDLLLFAAQTLQRPPEAVAQVLAQVIGQMVIRGLGVRVGQPQQQAPGIAIARGMPPAGIALPRGLRA